MGQETVVDYELQKYLGLCLVVQGMFLCALWGLLVALWRKSLRKSSRGRRGPSSLQWAGAGATTVLSFLVLAVGLEPAHWLLGLAMAIGAGLSLLDAAFAICFSLSMVLIRPWEILPDNGVMLQVPRFSMLFSMAWAAYYLVVRDRLRPRGSRALTLVFAYGCWIFLSTFVTPDPSAARATFNETMVRSLIMFALIHYLIRDDFAIGAVKLTLVMTFAGVATISLLFFANGYTDGGRLIAFGMFKNSNDAAAVMCILIPLAATPWLVKGSKLWLRLVSLAPLSLGLAVVAFSQSRGAVMSLAGAVGAQALRRMRNKTVGLMIVAALVGGGIAATSLFSRGAGDLEGSSASRKSFWEAGIRMAIYNPVFGVGFNEFPNNFDAYSKEIVGEWGYRTAHSSWILAFSEGGLIGLLLFAGVYGLGAIKNATTFAESDPSWLLAAVGYGVAITFLSHTYLLFPYILSAVITAAAMTKARQARRRFL